MEQLAIIQEMIDQSAPYNLEMECIWSMLSHLNKNLSDEELQTACNCALSDWDI